jgi:tetratricopeptide (TPR) repeat protein
MIALAGFAAAYNEFVVKNRVIREQEQGIESLREQLRALKAAGDWLQLRETAAILLTEVPGDSEAQDAIALAEQRETLDRQYVDAVAALTDGDVETSLTLFRQIEAQEPGYLDVRQRIETAAELQNLEALWQQSEAAIQAGDWDSAIALLTQIRSQNPEFRSNQVKEQLFQVHAQEADELIQGANGSVDVLRQAVGHQDEALKILVDQQLVNKRRLTIGFVAGADAFANEQWAEAVARWEEVYDADPGYQNGILPGYLDQAYPRAASELIARANGSISQLTLANRYLDRALATRPGNQGLIDERQLVNDFLAGADAYAEGNWDVAISRWGTAYRVRPDYQGGVLRERLIEACNQVESPDSSLCPP